MKQIGLEIYDTEGKARNYIEILKDLKRITIEMDEESKNNLIGDLFNQRSRRAIQIMMNDMGGLQKKCLRSGQNQLGTLPGPMISIA